MPRRALTRSIKAKPLPPEVAARYLLRWSRRDLYHHPEAFPRLDSPALFGNDCPLELEVGCGTGEFLCGLAGQERDANFVGVEPWTKVVSRAAETAAEQKLDNIRFVRAPMESLYGLLVPDSLRAVYVHYPDPNIRSKGQHKVFNVVFLEAMHRALEPEGRLSVISDHEELFAEMLGLVEQDSRWQKMHAERHLVGYEPEVKSRYQLLWEKHDVPPLRFEVEKRAS